MIIVIILSRWYWFAMKFVDELLITFFVISYVEVSLSLSDISDGGTVNTCSL